MNSMLGKVCAVCGHERVQSDPRPHYRCPKCREMYPHDGERKEFRLEGDKLTISLSAIPRKAVWPTTVILILALVLAGTSLPDSDFELAVFAYALVAAVAVVIPLMAYRAVSYAVLDRERRTCELRTLMGGVSNASRIGEVVNTQLVERYHYNGGEASGTVYHLYLIGTNGRRAVTAQGIAQHRQMFETASWGYSRTRFYTARSAELDPSAWRAGEMSTGERLRSSVTERPNSSSAAGLAWRKVPRSTS